MTWTIDDTLKLIQIGFYLAVATAAVLTYLSAKKGLLNTVNTEYHKRAFDKLEILSQELISEFDPDSPNYWGTKNIVRDCLKIIHKNFESNKEEILKTGEFNTGVPIREDYSRLDNLVQKTKSDPFIPEKVRNFVTKHLEERARQLSVISFEEMQMYIDELAKGKYKSGYDTHYGMVQNRINERLYDAGCGVSQVEEQVHTIRIFIQKYLEGFNPLK